MRVLCFDVLLFLLLLRCRLTLVWFACLPCISQHRLGTSLGRWFILLFVPVFVLVFLLPSLMSVGFCGLVQLSLLCLCTLLPVRTVLIYVLPHSH